MRTYNFSMLWRRSSSFRQVLPKFPYPSAMNINRHQVVKPRPPPMSSDALAQMYPNKYMTSKLTRPKSKKRIPYLSDDKDTIVDESQDNANKSSLLQSEQLRKLMFKSDSDEPESSDKPMDLYGQWQLKITPKQQRQQKELKSHGESQSSLKQQQQHQHRSKHQRQQQKEDVVISTTLSKPRPAKHLQPQQQQQQEKSKQQQHKEEKQVEKQVSLGDFGKKLKVQHENMQKIKERDRKLKDHVEKLKVFDRMNRLLKQQQEQEDKELMPYKPVISRAKDRSHFNRLNSPRSHTKVVTEQLRSPHPMHPVYTSRFKQPLDFAPYTPTNAQSDNGDVMVTKQHYKSSTPKLSPVTEFHKDKAAALETHRMELVNSRESALCNLCKQMNRQNKSKF
ncbi:putative cyclin-dependent serine/threonine-protein kinase DDB_G0272797/DDB_G0274007 [Drosophila innubila]|uniref:putative cyclin-dependent serine/threonine-protein kinase DDB_G0272797/DDB_G0274007 n=1 Tax=Drosophila innubila TaxID=198719 RepID=UPI00148C67B2|nr:putative cyclin-dependent serine/threonine-protein kinase DDB_G0272797/DDB_G0274007 [Drosophila innubila]